MTDLTQEAIAKAEQDLYGPKFCKHCQKLQPVRTYKLQGSDFTESEGMKVNIGFTGSRVCSVCMHTVDTE